MYASLVLSSVVSNAFLSSAARDVVCSSFSFIEARWDLSSLWDALFLMLSFPASWDLFWVPTVCLHDRL